LGGPGGGTPPGGHQQSKHSKAIEGTRSDRKSSNQFESKKENKNIFKVLWINFLSLNSKEKVSSTNHRHPQYPEGGGGVGTSGYPVVVRGQRWWTRASGQLLRSPGW